jgi:hypothetical protein
MKVTTAMIAAAARSKSATRSTGRRPRRLKADWFATYGTRLVAGRDFDDRDRPSAPAVAIVNETCPRTRLPARNPVGLHIRNPPQVPGETSAWMEVVGVVADATYLSLGDAVPVTLYMPLAQ